MNVRPHPSRIERVPEDGDSFSVKRGYLSMWKREDGHMASTLQVIRPG